MLKPDTDLPTLAPLNLLLLSSDSQEEHEVRSQLEGMFSKGYTLRCLENFDQLSEPELRSRLQVVLLDMRIDRSRALATIHQISNTCTSSALICLCREHEQLKTYGEIMHLVDDYIVPQSLMEGELAMRITHSIRRRSKEREFRHEQELYESLMNNIPDAIYFKDLNSRFTKVNKAMAELYGHDVSTVLGLTDFDLFTEEHARPAFEDEQQIIKTGEPLVGKVEKETFEDGRVNWVTTTKLPLYNRNREVIGTMGISRNITDLKSIEDALQAERNLLRTILSNLPDQIFVKNNKGRYLVSNPHHTAVLGASSESKVIGTTIHDHIPKPFADKLHQQDIEIVETNRPLINQVEYADNPDESRTWYLISKVPLISTTGETIGIIGISRDITDQKDSENKLRQTIHVLKDTQMQLIEAEKLKSVGRLAAGVAHEVKNPLGVVTLGMDFLKSKVENNAEALDVIADMQEATQKANNVIMELLDYSSPHEMTMEAKDIHVLIHRVQALMRHNFREAKVEVHDELGKDIGPVVMDETKMEQVFINLFLNAISVMPDGGELTLRSRMERLKHGGHNVSGKLNELFNIGERMIIIEVLDTGHGIDEQNKDKLFDPFYSTRNTGSGTGLGLSVTQSIVEMHRGLVTLENRDDRKGACARLIFPTPHKS